MLRTAKQPHTILRVDTDICALAQFPKRWLVAQPISINFVLKFAFANCSHILATIELSEYSAH
jgi:hypothetical protein